MNTPNPVSFVSAFSGFSVSDVSQAKNFYSQTLGLSVEQDNMGLHLHLPGGAEIFVYEKADHQPATFTILNLVVEDIDQAMANLQQKGLKFIHSPELEWPQDEHGVLRGLAAGMGPDIAWFNDPAGNILALLQTK